VAAGVAVEAVDGAARQKLKPELRERKPLAKL
jgi:hypothetical protein